jgi:hypothetical protein
MLHIDLPWYRQCWQIGIMSSVKKPPDGCLSTSGLHCPTYQKCSGGCRTAPTRPQTALRCGAAATGMAYPHPRPGRADCGTSRCQFCPRPTSTRRLWTAKLRNSRISVGSKAKNPLVLFGLVQGLAFFDRRRFGIGSVCTRPTSVPQKIAWDSSA